MQVLKLNGDSFDQAFLPLGSSLRFACPSGTDLLPADTTEVTCTADAGDQFNPYFDRPLTMRCGEVTEMRVEMWITKWLGKSCVAKV
jgi:hypothetical protein